MLFLDCRGCRFESFGVLMICSLIFGLYFIV